MEASQAPDILPLYMTLYFIWHCYYCCSVTKLRLTVCDPMDCITPGFSVLHYLSEFAPVHVHWLSDAIQPSHILLSPSPALSCPQSLFQWAGSSHQVAKVLELQALVLPMNIQGWFPLGLTSLISLMSDGLSRVFSRTTVWKHQFFSAQPYLQFNSHICALLEKA